MCCSTLAGTGLLILKRAWSMPIQKPTYFPRIIQSNRACLRLSTKYNLNTRRPSWNSRARIVFLMSLETLNQASLMTGEDAAGLRDWPLFSLRRRRCSSIPFEHDITQDRGLQRNLFICRGRIHAGPHRDEKGFHLPRRNLSYDEREQARISTLYG